MRTLSDDEAGRRRTERWIRALTEGPFRNGPPISTSLTIFFPALILPIVSALRGPRDDVLVLRPRVL